MVTTAKINSDGQLDIEVDGDRVGLAKAVSVLPGIRRKWDAFEGSLRKSLERAIALGQSLIDAKAKLPHGEFGKLFSDHAEPVKDALPFNSRWAQKLVKLAGHETIANASHDSHLPADLNTIYELSLMTAPALTQAIEEGRVTPQTTREEAKALRKESAVDSPSTPREPREKPKKSERDTLDDCAHTIEEAIADAILAYPSLAPAITARLRLIIQGFK